MCLEAGHIEVGNQIDHAHGPRHKGDVLQLRAGPLDHLEQALHHAAADQRLPARLVAGQVVQEREQSGGQGLKRKLVSLSHGQKLGQLAHLGLLIGC